ncbi:unnamed protein product [Nippostrongylus brasiliensis]|uniref:3-hydroxyacyl-CoA dehydrogenase C-terminal domain-containing protein n=1 Tax=Nippostrongylus brasiliensis TaxID=27835 RepID=A0A0N4XDA4_NIPBR|nr:unnamed protein product [Nippostrongylus brasiliensis]
MVNEGFLCLEEGMIEDEMLIDILFVLGFGWPLRTAGPMRWARSVGLENIAERVAYWSKLEPDDRSYNLSRTLEVTLKMKSQL